MAEPTTRDTSIPQDDETVTLPVESLLVQYDRVVAELTRSLTMARAEIEALRERLRQS